jgi:hypothetical protein
MVKTEVFRFPYIHRSEPENHENILEQDQKGRNVKRGERKPPVVNIKKDEA